MMNYSAFIKNISTGVLEKACRDASRGDPLAAAWLLSLPASLYSEVSNVEPEVLGELAYKSLESMINGC
jgi:hypothetical protein